MHNSADQDPLVQQAIERLRNSVPATPGFDERIMAEVREAHAKASGSSLHPSAQNGTRARSFYRRGVGIIGITMAFAAGATLFWTTDGFKTLFHHRITPPQTAVQHATAEPSARPSRAPARHVRTVRFSIPDSLAQNARQVAVVGSFNAWNRTSILCHRLDNGSWVADVPLPKGRYVYQFVVDGVRWVADPAAPRDGASDFGDANSVVTVVPGE